MDCPKEVRKELDVALANFKNGIDKACTFEHLKEWFESDLDGRDALVMNMRSATSVEDLEELQSDRAMAEYGYVQDSREISDSDRVLFFREMAAHRLSESLTSVHCVDIGSREAPVAKLYFICVDNGPGGLEFHDIRICKSLVAYLSESGNGDLILDDDSRSDEQILSKWRRG